MKNLYIILISLVIVSSTFSQNIIGSFGGGISAPMGDFANGYNVGFNVSGNLGFKVHRIAGARLDLQYNSFSSSSDLVDGNFSLVSVTADAILINTDKLKSKSGFAPYGILGLGMYFVNPPDIKLFGTTLTGESKSYFGIGVGGGAVYKLSKNLGIFGELKYSFTLGGEQFNYVPLKIGLMFN